MIKPCQLPADVEWQEKVDAFNAQGESPLRAIALADHENPGLRLRMECVVQGKPDPGKAEAAKIDRAEILERKKQAAKAASEISAIADNIYNAKAIFDYCGVRLTKKQAKTFVRLALIYKNAEGAEPLKDSPLFKKMLDKEKILLWELRYLNYEMVAKNPGDSKILDAHVTNGGHLIGFLITNNKETMYRMGMMYFKGGELHSYCSLENIYSFFTYPPRRGTNCGIHSRTHVLFVMAKTVEELKPNLNAQQRAQAVLDILIAAGAEDKPDDGDLKKAKTIQSTIDRVERETHEGLLELMTRPIKRA